MKILIALFMLGMSWTLFCAAAQVRAGLPERRRTSATGAETADLGRAPRSRNRKLGRGLGWWLRFQRAVRRVG